MALLNRDDLTRWPQLDEATRQRWLTAAISDRAVARDLKLAMALQDGAEMLARNWVTQAHNASRQSRFWRPALGAAAALGLAAVLFQDRPANESVMTMTEMRGDQIGVVSFEAESDVFGGSFETM